MRRSRSKHFRTSLPAALLAVVMAFLSFPVPTHACRESVSMACSCCCRHEAAEPMDYCADNETAPMTQDVAAAESPTCCFTVYVESGAPSLPARTGSESIPVLSVVVIERAPLPPADAAVAASDSASHPHGARPHLVLCQLLV